MKSVTTQSSSGRGSNIKPDGNGIIKLFICKELRKQLFNTQKKKKTTNDSVGAVGIK